MTTLVVGSGGLLGSAVCRELRRRGEPVITPAVPWREPAAALEVLAQAFGELVTQPDWRVAWCAGAGVVATAQEDLDAEVALFSQVLDRWQQALPGLGASQGGIFLASSAGGVYAGSGQVPFTEHTPPRPVIAYGHAKLAMEDRLRAFSRATGVPALIGRISNLYGPGQDLAKGQGLISAICRAYVTGEPLPVHVPLDTCRDYVYVDDCAKAVVTGLQELPQYLARHRQPDQVVTRILAASHGGGHTIAELFDVATGLYGTPPPQRPGSSGAGQVADLRFDSVIWLELDDAFVTPIATGMAATMNDVRRRSGGQEG